MCVRMCVHVIWLWACIDTVRCHQVDSLQSDCADEHSPAASSIELRIPGPGDF